LHSLSAPAAACLDLASPIADALDEGVERLILQARRSAGEDLGKARDQVLTIALKRGLDAIIIWFATPPPRKLYDAMAGIEYAGLDLSRVRAAHPAAMRKVR
jgi:hypothetical protein